MLPFSITIPFYNYIVCAVNYTGLNQSDWPAWFSSSSGWKQASVCLQITNLHLWMKQSRDLFFIILMEILIMGNISHSVNNDVFYVRQHTHTRTCNRSHTQTQMHSFKFTFKSPEQHIFMIIQRQITGDKLTLAGQIILLLFSSPLKHPQTRPYTNIFGVYSIRSVHPYCIGVIEK